jgi:hypothetical protein
MIPAPYCRITDGQLVPAQSSPVKCSRGAQVRYARFLRNPGEMDGFHISLGKHLTGQAKVKVVRRLRRLHRLTRWNPIFDRVRFAEFHRASKVPGSGVKTVMKLCVSLNNRKELHIFISVPIYPGVYSSFDLKWLPN